ncbi:hypothetical protein DVH24_022758 [Malus domestica]|uniref:Uncharacterized protein n=1 Tax=Malus domestica TaxID=3750 RepID=A0A498KQ86_MALDO|nr:uncharacterized protein LOC103439173 isoform X1 [Malus domestica]RXI08614.1 hypothetical protein DVH24_022758 [Malus domestica]
MRLAERREGGTRRRKTTAASSWTGREKAFCSPLAVFVQIQVTSLYGGPLEFMFIVQSTEDPAYRAVSMLLSELKDEVDAKIVVAGISTTCSQKIHNQLVCT